MSIQIKGKVEIRVIDSRNGEIKQVIEQNNIVTNATLLNILHWNNFTNLVPGNVFGGQRISISTQVAEPLIFNSTVNNIIATGYIPSGVTSPTFNTTTNPIFGQIQNRVDYTGTVRSFTTVALTGLGSAVTQNNVSSSAAAYLLLDSVCVQGEFDFLDIFYRVEFLNTEGTGFYRPRALVDFGYMCFGLFSYAYGGSPTPYSAAFEMGSAWASLCQMPDKVYPYEALYYAEDVGLTRSFFYPGNPNWGAVIVNSHYKVKPGKSFALAEAVGYIFNMMLQGRTRDDTGVYTFSAFRSNNNPFQNLFGHSSNATVPFFDSLRLPSGNGKVYLGGNWTNRIPELYRITIVASGATGIATYKWSARKHLGFNGNTYTDLAVRCPYRNHLLPSAMGMHGWRDENNDVLRYSNTQIIQYDDSGITLLDIFTGAYKNWDATTTPALGVTQARQCATDGSKIYVACRQTGLWVIDVTANTVTQPLTNPCYGVDVGRNVIAYAIVEGGLYRSSDWSTPLTFTYAGITDANWSKAYFLKADPEHIEDRLAIVMQPPVAGNRRVVWYRVNAPIIPAGVFQFNNFGDAEGVCYWIGTNYGTATWSNPHDVGRVTVVMSTTETGSANFLVNRQGGQNIHTNSIANSWIAIDLGAGNTLTPNYYILQLRGQFTGHAIRNWKLQGSNNVVSNSVANLNAATWTDLDVRVNDTSMDTNPDSWAGYTANAAQGYRWLRILQTGLSSSNDNYLILGEFEFYGTFSSTTNSRIPQSRSLNQTALGTESTGVKPWAASLDVSDTGSFWAIASTRLTYGNAITTNLASTTVPNQSLTHSVWGTDNYYKVNFFKNYLIAQDRIVDANATVINSYISITGRSFILHMDGGIVLTNREMRQLFTDNNFCYSNYGWNGSNWELNHPGARTTHSLEQLLANGVTIRFEDGTNTPHFTATDYYTQSLNYGLLKDNATTVYYESAWYSKPVKFDYPVQAGLTVPATSTNPPPTATRHWRLRNLTPSTGGTDGNWGYREIIFRNEAGADITTGGIASASFNSSTANRAFDKNTSNGWDGERYGLHWIQYTFANPVTVYGISINGIIPGTNYGMPTDYTLEYSPDSGLTWLSAYDFKTSIILDNTYYNILHRYNTAYEVYLDAKNDPNFITAEVDSVELTKLTLNEQPLTTTYAESGIPPAPNEAVIFGNGRVKFNAADSAKTVGGTYAWIKS